MKHKTWFRLVIKAIGVLLIGLSLRDVTELLVGLVYAMTGGGGWSLYPPSGIPIGGMNAIESFISLLFSLTPTLIEFAFGLYLFFGGKWIVNKAIPSNRPYCPECGYDLSHNASAANCPECGVALPAQATQP